MLHSSCWLRSVAITTAMNLRFYQRKQPVFSVNSHWCIEENTSRARVGKTRRLAAPLIDGCGGNSLGGTWLFAFPPSEPPPRD